MSRGSHARQRLAGIGSPGILESPGGDGAARPFRSVIRTPEIGHALDAPLTVSREVRCWRLPLVPASIPFRRHHAIPFVSPGGPRPCPWLR